MENLDIQVVNRLIALGIATAGPQMASGANVPYVMVSDGNGGFEPKPMPELIFNDNEKKMARIKQTVTVADPASFCEYFTSYRDSGSRIFADEATRSVTGVLDYHVAAEDGDEPIPRHGAHKVCLQLRHSVQWNTWIAANNKKFTQQEFAEFLEQNAMDITRPRPADMMEVARDLQATVDVQFGSAIRNNDGRVNFKYSEEVKATVGGGSVAVPENFQIGVPIFMGANNTPLDALLRFRVNGGKLQIWFTFVRWEEAVHHSFLAARQKIADDLSLTIIDGSIS